MIKALSTFDGIETKTLEQNLSIMTAHGSKGQESSRVIILDVTKKQFPKIHPDNLLFELFGVTPHTVLEEERRLFYVAMTRAEHELYLVTEKDNESHYLAEISGSAVNSRYENIDPPIPLPLGDFAQRIQKKMSDLSGAAHFFS